MDCSFGAIQNPSKLKGLFNKGSFNREALWHIGMLSVSGSEGVRFKPQ